MGPLVESLRYASRRLVRDRAFATTAILTIALAIGANTAIFSLIRAVLLEPLPYGNAARLVMIWHRAEEPGGTTWLSAREVMGYATSATSLEHVAGYDLVDANLTGGAEPERVRAATVTASGFAALAVPPLLGRTLTEADDQPGASDAVVIGHGLWQRAFGGAPDIIGRTIRVSGRARSVVGVMPPAFRMPLDYRQDRPTELWLPLAIDPANLGGWGDRGLVGFGLLREGVGPARASAELERIGDAWIQQGFVADQGDGRLQRSAVPMREFVTGGIRRPLFILFGAVAFVLLIACANVANLLLARADTRRRELAIRTALGARRRDVVRQLLAESTVLAAFGGTLGVALAVAGTRTLVALRPPGLPRVENVGIDPVTLAFTAGLALLTALAFGLGPALHAARARPIESLKDEGPSATASLVRRRLRHGLVVIELAVSVVLLIGAGLLLRSFQEMRRVDLGFEPKGVLTLRLSPASADYPESSQIVSFYRRLVDRVEQLPGVRSAAAVRVLPLSSTIGDWTITLEGRPFSREENPNGDWQVVTPGYFETMGIDLVRGRFLEDGDDEVGQLVAVINEPMAERYWAGEDVIGKRFHLGTADRPWITVVGVVRPVRHNAVLEDQRAEMYLPHSQFPAQTRAAPYGMTLVVSADENPMALVGPVRAAVRATDANTPVADVRAMDDVVADALARPRFTALLLGLFAALAVALAAVGIYATISLLVVQRAHEIGIRMALGARESGIVRMMLAQSLGLTALGVGFGLAGSLLLTRVLNTMVYGVGTLDPVTFASVPLGLGLVALVACVIPALRAAALDPVATLRRA